MTDKQIEMSRFVADKGATTYKDTEQSKQATSVNWEETIRRAKANRTKNKKSK